MQSMPMPRHATKLTTAKLSPYVPGADPPGLQVFTAVVLSHLFSPMSINMVLSRLFKGFKGITRVGLCITYAAHDELRVSGGDMLLDVCLNGPFLPFFTNRHCLCSPPQFRSDYLVSMPQKQAWTIVGCLALSLGGSDPAMIACFPRS